MIGFDPEFVDIIDYILRITRRIWEGKQTHLCRDYYSDDCPIYTLAGMSVGAEEVTQNTDDTLKAFPDRVLHADAVICGGNDIDGFHTSHLIHTEMTNVGDSEFGPATGKFAAIKVIAHCIIKENRIIEEWLVRDNYSLVEQLGLDPHSVAKERAESEPQERFKIWRENEIARVNSDARSDDSLIGSMLDSIWNSRRLTTVSERYASDAKLHASANREHSGLDDIQRFYAQLFEAFTDLRFSVDYVCDQAFRLSEEDTPHGHHVAARWTLVGQHTEPGAYGEPTHVPVLIMGESQYHIIDGLIQEEWTVFDELSIMVQIYRARL